MEYGSDGWDALQDLEHRLLVNGEELEYIRKEIKRVALSNLQCTRTVRRAVRALVKDRRDKLKAAAMA